MPCQNRWRDFIAQEKRSCCKCPGKMDAKTFSPVTLTAYCSPGIRECIHKVTHPIWNIHLVCTIAHCMIANSLFSNVGSSISRHQEHQHLKQAQQHGQGHECENLDENLDVNLYEEHGQCHRKICISLESNMAVTHLQVVKRQDSLRQNKILDVQYIGWGISVNLTKKFVTVIKNPKPGGDHCFHCLRTSLKLTS